MSVKRVKSIAGHVMTFPRKCIVYDDDDSSRLLTTYQSLWMNYAFQNTRVYLYNIPSDSNNMLRAVFKRGSPTTIYIKSRATFPKYPCLFNGTRHVPAAQILVMKNDMEIPLDFEFRIIRVNTRGVIILFLQKFQPSPPCINDVCCYEKSLSFWEKTILYFSDTHRRV